MAWQTGGQPDEMMIQQLRETIREALLGAHDSTYRIGEVVATEGEVLGVRVPAIRALAKSVQASHRELTLDIAVRLLDLAFADRAREEILLGVFLLGRMRGQFGPELWPNIGRWVDGIDNWETCDQLAMNVAGEVVARDPSLFGELLAWTRSPDRWRKRFAVASTVVLNQQGRRHTMETLRVCEPLLGDKDPVVVKAVGWAIRQVCSQDEEATYVFLTSHKAVANPRMLREAAEKLSPAHKAALLEG